MRRLNDIINMDNIIKLYKDFEEGKTISPIINNTFSQTKIRDIIIEYLYSNQNKGYLYCLHNDSFYKSGKYIYKIGYTKNISSRLSTYKTSHFEDFKIAYSINIKYYKAAERIIFTLLDKYRYRYDREFFDCPLDIIIDHFKKIEDIINTKNILEIIETYDVIKQKDKNNIKKFLALLFSDTKIIKFKIRLTFEEKLNNLNLNVSNIAPDIKDFLNNDKNYRAIYLYKALIDKKFLESKKIKCSDMCNLKLLDDLHLLLNINWFDTDLLRKLRNNKKKIIEPFHIPDDLYNQFCMNNRFQVRMKEKPSKYIECVIFLLKRYTLFSTDIIVCKKQNLSLLVNKEQKRYSVPLFSDLYHKLNTILNYNNIQN